MKKNVKEINESHIRAIVAESVKKALNELDWKTYANARKKAAERGQYDRALRFGTAANKEFNDKFGYQGDKESEYYEPNVRGDVFLNRIEANSSSNGFNSPSHRLYHMHDEKPYNYDSTKAFGIMDKYDTEDRYKRVKNPNLKRFFNNPEQEKKFKAASKEFDNYNQGKYSYDNGWKLNESSIKSAVKEAIDNVLNEGGVAYGSVVPSLTGPSATGRETWRGVKGSRFVWHGEWADPEIIYDGVELNGTEAEEMLWDRYKEDCEEQGIQTQDDAAYEDWVKNSGEAECVLIDMVNATEGV